MKKGIIVQARMSSTRLPGKVLKKVGDKTLLEYQVERLRECKSIEEVIIATTTSDEDNPIVELCQQKGVDCFRGSEEDVLSRYYETAKCYKLDLICRATSDCPLIDPHIIDRVVNYYLYHHPQVEFVMSSGYPLGMSAEVFSYKDLEEAYHKAKKGYEREHVTPYFYAHPFRDFKIGRVTPDYPCEDYRLTVDTPEDLKLIENILKNLYPKKRLFSLDDIFELMKQHPSLQQINPHIKQKTLHE